MKLAILLSLFLISEVCGQPCEGTATASLPGTWKAGMQGSINHVSAASLAKQKEFVAGLVKQLQQHYTPQGFTISYSGVYGYENPKTAKNRKADSYEASMAILPLTCEKGKVVQAHETSFWLNVLVNKMPFSLSQSFFVPMRLDEEDPDTDRWGQLDRKPVRDRDTWLLKRNFIGGFGKELTEYQWFFTSGEKLPFRYVDQREVCTKLKSYLQKKIAHTTSEDDIGFFKKKIGFIEDYLGKTSATELGKPALVRGSVLAAFDQYEDSVEPFYKENEPYTSWVIAGDDNYFKGNLPLHTPQIITVKFTVDEKNALQMSTMEKLIAALNFETLKSRLGTTHSANTGKP